MGPPLRNHITRRNTAACGRGGSHVAESDETDPPAHHASRLARGTMSRAANFFASFEKWRTKAAGVMTARINIILPKDARSLRSRSACFQ